jgi:hypothetical protein
MKSSLVTRCRLPPLFVLPVDGPIQPELVLLAAAVIREKDEEMILQVRCRRDKEASMLLLSLTYCVA